MQLKMENVAYVTLPWKYGVTVQDKLICSAPLFGGCCKLTQLTKAGI